MLFVLFQVHTFTSPVKSKIKILIENVLFFAKVPKYRVLAVYVELYRLNQTSITKNIFF